MEHGWPLQSLATRDNRVSSPRAAKPGALVWRLRVTGLRLSRDIALDVLHLLRPAAVIPAECFEAGVTGDFIEARLSDHEQRAGGGLLQPEFDERGRFPRIVYLGIHSVRVAGKGKQPLGLHLLPDRLPFDVLVSGDGDLAARDLARHKRAVEFDAKPFAEFAVIGQSTPNTGNGSLKFNAFLDCMVHLLRNLQVAYSP